METVRQCVFLSMLYIAYPLHAMSDLLRKTELFQEHSENVEIAMDNLIY